MIGMEKLLTFSFLIVFGWLFGAWYGRKTRGFNWREYLMLLLLPLAGVFWLTRELGMFVITLYVLSAVGGTFLEWLLGFAYHRAAGVRLWRYNRLSLGGYTSILSVPFWGLAGIFFLLLAKAFSF